MEKKFCGIVLLLLLLLTHELMMHTEARTCYSRSKNYHGRCYFRNQISNCRSLCRQETFTTGRCIRGACVCSKKCGTPGGHPSHPPPSHPPPSPPAGGGDDDNNGGGEDGEMLHLATIQAK